MDQSDARRPYHHGDLKAALLEQAEIILERDGIQALTLRAAARAAGVSHAAPANHFGDLTGLLSELAAVGFRRFSAMLSAARATGEDRPAGARGMGHAYVTFARTYPNLFALMFRGERLDTDRPALREALDEAASVLRSTTAGASGGGTPSRAAAQAAARWSLVHGFAMLLLDGRLAALVASLPAGEGADDLLEAVLAVTRFGD